MVPTDTPFIKGTGSSTEQKPATIVYHPPGGRDRQVGAATHHIVSSDGEVHVYLGDRREGIDSTLPLNRCEIHRSDKGCETFGADVDASAGDGSGSDEEGNSDPHADSQKGIVMDGGRHDPRGADFRGVDYVEYNGDGYRLEWIVSSERLVISKTHEDLIEVPASECTPTDEWGTPLTGDSNDDSDPDIVTDGGRDVLLCTRCGADLVETVEMGMAKVSSHNGQAQVMVVPTATCECGASVGADLGQRVVQALVDVLGDPHDDDQELVTDGGQVIEPGDVVSHEDRGRHRVAHVNESHVEIYRLGDGSDVVPLSSVEIAPESVAADGGDA